MTLFSIPCFSTELPTLPLDKHTGTNTGTHDVLRDKEERFGTWNPQRFLPPSLSFLTWLLRELGRLSLHGLYESHPSYPQP